MKLARARVKRESAARETPADEDECFNSVATRRASETRNKSPSRVSLSKLLIITRIHPALVGARVRAGNFEGRPGQVRPVVVHVKTQSAAAAPAKTAPPSTGPRELQSRPLFINPARSL